MSKEEESSVYHVQDEVSLLRASLGGEVEAWGEIVSRYKEAILGLCMGFLRNHPDAEDISHDTFIRAYENLHRYHMEKRFSTWIFTIASNLCRNRLRYRRRHPIVPLPVQMEGGCSPAITIAQEDRQAQIRQGLSRLPYRYRAAITLRYYNDLSYHQIARILSLPEGTIKTHIHRGKALLRKEIGEMEVVNHV